MNTLVRKGIKRLVLAQVAITTLMTLLFASFQGLKGAYSAMLGGIVCTLPNLYFALKLFQYQGAQAATHIVKAFYKGEAVKLLITGALFVIVFKLVTLAAVAFFITFIVVQWLFWIAPWLFVTKK